MVGHILASPSARFAAGTVVDCRCKGWLACCIGLLNLALALALLMPVVSMAQVQPQTQTQAQTQTPKVDDPSVLIEAARKLMLEVRKAMVDGAEDAALLDARRLALTARAQADAAATALGTELADVQARLTELGTPAAGVRESADIAAQRAQLVKSQSTLDSQAKLARLLSVEAEQAASTVWAQRRSQFNAQLFERTLAPTRTAFWRELGSEWPDDLLHLRSLLAALGQRVAGIATQVWLVLAGIGLALLAARKPAGRLIVHLIVTRTPEGRLRRSLHAAGMVLVWTFLPGLFAHALYLALTADGSLTPELRELLAGFDGIVWFGGFCAGLGLALLMPGKPSWRLPPISDTSASRLRWFPPALAFTMVLAWTSTRLSAAADASLASTVALKGLAAFTLALLMLVALAQLRRVRRARRAAALAEADGGAPHAEPAVPEGGTPLWWPTLSAGVTLLVVVSLLGLLTGYVAMGAFIINQLVWTLIVSSVTWFLAVAIDDLFMALLAPTVKVDTAAEAPGSPAAAAKPAARQHTREQLAVWLSGLCRVALILFALVLLLAPFGEGPLELSRRAGKVSDGLTIGEIHILPVTLLQGLLVLVVGLFVVRRLKAWLGERLMPTTRMDAGMRLSVTTLFGYMGAVAVVALAMSAIGVGLERVAWIASALSVGIGFGLQAVVQNFVSGLILLAERPVKVGDWVSLAGVEGDIRRINVRATEIQMGDRSTVIVPNSEFITKIVRNVTYADSIGLVQIKLPMPLATDAAKAKAVLLDAFVQHPGVLETPAPNVQLDGIDGHYLVFNATGFVSSPRAAYGVKSELLFEVMERLREAGLSLALPPTMVMTMPGAGSPADGRPSLPLSPEVPAAIRPPA